MRYRFLRFPGGKFKALTLSYDDGVRSDIRLCGILNKYNIKCTFNLNSEFLGADNANRLNTEEVKQYIISSGHEVAVHGANHIAPGCASPVVGINDVLECRKSLENQFGTIIRGMAYPDSGVRRLTEISDKNDIKTYLKMLGIVYARTLGGDNNNFELPVDWYEWMPTAHHINPNLMDYLNDFLNISSDSVSPNLPPKLFYLWGHSYEFDRNNNWNLIEKFCKKASGKLDIWYATNIEIYEYINAYRSLIFNAENTLVYNPTLFDIWFCVDGKNYSVKSGETLKIN